MPTIHIPGHGYLAADRNPRSHRRWDPYSLALLFCVLSGTAFAENLNMKPGLWEYTRDWSGGPTAAAQRAQLEKELAKVPPDQRAKMEATMKEVMSAVAEPVRKCVTKEDINKHLDLPVSERDSGNAGTCTDTIVKSTSDVLEIREECSKSDHGMKGIVTIQYLAPNPETVTITVEATSPGGGATAPQPKVITRGKWMGPDCGSVKPSFRD